MSGYVRARGLGVSPDGEKAIPFLEKSCNGGFGPACNVLNQMTGQR
jgi:TPR repeat protein